MINPLSSNANLLQLPPALSAADVQKLILKRNERFEAAVNE
jgi:hypothetical protein